MTSKAYKKQVGGSHYRDMKIQPSQFINENKLPFAEGSAISTYADTLPKERNKIYIKQYII